MKRMIIAVSVALMLIPLLIGCNGNNKSSYEQITPAEAKALMDSEEGYIILDVRTPEEFAERHIEGAILIPDYEIGEKAESILTDKDQLILVYCRSGRRSKNAANELAALGYTNIKEFGGINDWKYGTVAEAEEVEPAPKPEFLALSAFSSLARYQPCCARLTPKSS